jgi:transposase
MEPQEIQDEAHEQILERVAAVDVAKASGMVCTRMPHPSRPGSRQTLVWQVDATMNAILELADHLVAGRVQKVTLESTSDYWRIWYYLLEAAGLDVQLIRARDLRQAPGRPKTDKIDCVWQAKCTEKGLLRPSFVPPAEIRELRDYTRLRIDLTRERTRHYSRLEKLLEVGCSALSGQRIWSYFMPHAAGSGTRRGLPAESCSRVPNGDGSDYTGAQCTAQCPHTLS